jgi:DNA-binding transcriptional LysR family regulator
MEFRQLRYLVTVAEEGSFTRAARRLHVAQPGISAQVKELERELGEPLLDRAGRTVRPTAAGAAVLPYARAALDAVEGARQAVSELTGLIQGHVTVGAVASVAAVDLPGLLVSFHDKHPGVRISLSEGTSSQLLAELHAGRLDLIVFGAADQAAPGVATQVIASEPLAAVVAAGHPLAAREHLAAVELRDRPLICLPPGSGLRACLEQACAQAGFRPHVAFESTDPRTLIELAAAGLGLAVLSESGARSRAGNLRTLRLSGTTARALLLLGWRDDAAISPAARALVRHARALLAEPTGPPEPTERPGTR